MNIGHGVDSGVQRPATFKRVYTEDPTQIIPLTFFAPGFDYKLFGFIPTDRHLIGVEGVNPEETLFLLGTDLEGRDMWSRVMFATRTSWAVGRRAPLLNEDAQVVDHAREERLVGNRFEVAWVGDSRVYVLRNAALEQITHDHSWVEEQVRAAVPEIVDVVIHTEP